MKKLFLLLCLPFSVFAQDEKIQPPKQNNWEAGVNFNACFVTKDAYRHSMNLGGMNILSCYRNFGNIQVGAAFEYNLVSFIDAGSVAQFTPYALLNRTFDLKRLYLYAGGMLGYTHVGTKSIYEDKGTSGYTTGLQAGGVYRLGEHLGLNLETGVRSEQLWTTLSSDHGPSNRSSYFNVYFPVSVGVRFRF